MNAAEDKKKLDLIQARNSADALIHSVKKSLAEHGSKIEASEKSAIESALKEAEAALTSEDKATIDAKSEALMSASQKLGEKIYAQTQAEAQSQASPGGASASASKAPEDNVVDAEFTEVKEKK